MLTHFANDLQKLGTKISGLNQAAQDALIAQGIEWYYWQPTNYSGKEFFTSSGSLLQYTPNNKNEDSLNKGANKAFSYVSKWLDPIIQAEGGYTINYDYEQWNVAAGNFSSGAVLNATKSQLFIGGRGSDIFTGGNAADLLLGGVGADTLDGDGGSDKLFGGAGADTLDGGSGFDELKGGKDFDTYKADKHDTITDTDGKGVVILGTTTLGLAERKKGESDYIDSAGNIYVQSGSTLTINGGLRILDWKDGDLGITLKEKDVDQVKKNVKIAETIPSPIALDLDGDGVETTAVSATGVHFDHAADGFAEATGWIGADDGLLVRDLNGDGRITSGRELFGSETVLGNGTKAANGFEALRQLDSNADGKIDASDADYASLRVWKDTNANGGTDAGELLTLAEAGVQSIKVAYTSGATIDAQGNEHRQVGSYTTTAGATRAAEDIWFKVDRTYSVATDNLPVSADIAALPDASGYGKVRDLRQAMLRDSSGTLKALVTQFTQASTREARQALLNPIIYKWAGVENVDPNSRASAQFYGNVIGDARKLEALEEFIGEEWFGMWCWGKRDPNPHGHAAPVLLQAYADLSDRIYGELAAGSFLKPLFNAIRFYREENGTVVHGDLSAVTTLIAGAVNLNRSAGKELLGEFMRALRGKGLMDAMDIVPFGVSLGALGPDVQSVLGANVNAQIANYWTIANAPNNLVGTDGPDVLQGYAGNDTLTGKADNDVLDGGEDWDVLYGNEGDDTLLGGRGVDQLYGGVGQDTYYFGRGDGNDTIIDDYLEDSYITIGDLTLAELKFQRVGAALQVSFTSSASDSITLADFFKNGEPKGRLILQKNTGESQVLNAGALIQMTLIPTENTDVLNGSSLADTINALGGDDLVYGRAGNDVIAGGAGSDALNGGDGNDRLDGGVGNDRLYGDAGQDTLLGGGGDDLLDGGADADQMSGGIGNDVYLVDNAGDVITELANEGVDTVQANANITLAANVENANLMGIGDLNATGNTQNNVLTGNAGVNTLLGLDGDDALYGGAGNDAMDGGVGADLLHGEDGNDVLAGGTGNDVLDGGSGGDRLDGGDGDDRVYGQAGNDILSGGAGSDLLEGNDGNDQLAGGAGNDLLDGGAGADVLVGDLGDDTYIVDDAADVVTELAGAGVDTVNASVGITMNANVENLLLVGYSAINATGNAQANIMLGNDQANALWGMDGNDELHGNGGTDSLYGGAGNDTLDGGTGQDTLAGGVGDDMYWVDRSDDVVVELAGEGNDTVRALSNYTLSVNVENLILDATGGYIDGTGNDQANRITGNDYGNRLDGGAGADTLEGGWGDDTYVVDTLADQVIEAVDEGFDTVDTALTYELGQNIERLQLTGNANADGFGNELGNVLAGNDANNKLDGGAGADNLVGGLGDDTYYTDEQGDRIQEYEGEGMDTEVRSFETSYILTDGVENLQITGTVFRGNGNSLDNVITGNAADNNLWGGQGNDTLIGGAGNDALFGDVGQDTLIGGVGDDYYQIDDAADSIVENANEGDDFVRSAVSWTLGANLERLAVDGSDALTVTGNSLNNGLWGNAGANVLTGGLGSDYMSGGLGNDVYVFNKGDGQDTIDNTDVVGAVDVLRFGTGILDADVQAFQQGSDMYFKVKNTTDTVFLVGYYSANAVVSGQTTDKKIDRVEFANGVVWNQAMIQAVVDRATNNRAPVINSFLPTLQAKANSTFSYTVAANTITDPDAWDSITYSVKMADGSAVPGWLSFDAATRTLSGTPGVASVGTLQFVLWGTDNYGYSAGAYVNMTIGAANRSPVLSSALADQTAAQGGTFSYTVPTGAFTDPDAGDSLSYTATLADGSALPSWLSFNAATRVFSGTPTGTGTLSVKVIAKDTSGLSASDIFDVVVSVQNLTLNGTANADVLNGGAGNDTLNGLAGNDTLNGGAGNDKLDGGAGNDTLVGGAGDDTYVVDAAADVVTEAANAGADTVQSSVTYTLSANVENLTLTGTAAINGTGNDLANTLTGNAGDNSLDGGVGADTLVGGAGNDTYYVDNVADVTTEAASSGTDTVISRVNWTLGTNLENLTLAGIADLNGTGNTLANVLTGNTGNNILDGGAGADTLVGGAGDDTYIVDNTTDVVTEALNAGTDLVQSSVTYTLSASVENLTLTGTTSINGTGNTLDNVLTGNSAANVLAGGAGNDTYIVGTGDTTVESASAGTDTVQSSITWTLATNVENLTLTGTTAINGTGNMADNVLLGSSAANTLTGNAGNDTLNGGAGADSLFGGVGNDTYWLGRGYGIDTITENDTTAGNTDIARFDAGIAVHQLWFTKTGNNLDVSIIGTSDKFTLSNWYLGNQYHVEQFKTSDGKTLLDSQVQNLVNAMASFAPPAAGQTTLPANYATSLIPVIAANWN